MTQCWHVHNVISNVSHFTGDKPVSSLPAVVTEQLLLLRCISVIHTEETILFLQMNLKNSMHESAIRGTESCVLPICSLPKPCQFYKLMHVPVHNDSLFKDSVHIIYNMLRNTLFSILFTTNI